MLKKFLKPVQRRHAPPHPIDAYRISARRACRVLRLQRASFAYQPHRRDNTLLRQRQIVQVWVRYGSQRLYILLRREGWPDNHKRVHGLYCLEGLNLRSKRPRRNRAAAHRLERLPLGRLHQSWSVDFMADNLFDGRKIRVLTIVDNKLPLTDSCQPRTAVCCSPTSVYPPRPR